MLLATLLKTRQDLGYFATPDEVHPDTASYLVSQMDPAIPPTPSDEERRTKTLYRYQAAVRAHLSVTAYAEAGERLVSSTTLEAAQTMSDQYVLDMDVLPLPLNPQPLPFELAL
jgi:Domain of unknown function (DUF4158)